MPAYPWNVTCLLTFCMWHACLPLVCDMPAYPWYVTCLFTLGMWHVCLLLVCDMCLPLVCDMPAHPWWHACWYVTLLLTLGMWLARLPLVCDMPAYPWYVFKKVKKHMEGRLGGSSLTALMTAVNSSSSVCPTGLSWPFTSSCGSPLSSSFTSGSAVSSTFPLVRAPFTGKKTHRGKWVQPWFLNVHLQQLGYVPKRFQKCRLTFLSATTKSVGRP